MRSKIIPERALSYPDAIFGGYYELLNVSDEKDGIKGAKWAGSRGRGLQGYRQLARLPEVTKLSNNQLPANRSLASLWMLHVPRYLAWVCGGIGLATATSTATTTQFIPMYYVTTHTYLSLKPDESSCTCKLIKRTRVISTVPAVVFRLPFFCYSTGSCVVHDRGSALSRPAHLSSSWYYTMVLSAKSPDPDPSLVL